MIVCISAVSITETNESMFTPIVAPQRNNQSKKKRSHSLQNLPRTVPENYPLLDPMPRTEFKPEKLTNVIFLFF